MNEADTSRRCVEAGELPELCKACVARHRGICGALTSSELAEISKVTTRRRFEPDRIVYPDREDQPWYANILAGIIKLSKTLSDGRQQIVDLQFSPDFLGRPFIKQSQLSAETASDVHLCTFPRAALERMLEKVPALEHRLYQQSLNELDDARNWLLALGRKNASERVASFLVRICRNVPRSHDPHADDVPEIKESIAFDLPLTRADIADFLGLTIETVSRQLTKLKTSGIIRLTANRHVEVPDLQKLILAAGDDPTSTTLD